MKLFKKLFVLTILITMITSLVACGGNDDDCEDKKPANDVCTDF